MARFCFLNFCIVVAVITHSTSAESWKRTKRQQVGSRCTENIDCLTSTGGAYCDSTKVCACLPTSTSIGGFCWPKINPGQTGCQYQAQCDSIWPGAQCDSSNTCRCPNNQPPSVTNDGTVCNNAGACPTNGLNSKLKETSTGADTRCVALTSSCPGVNDYDCFCSPVPASTDAACAATALTYCCPSRALACIMPREEGVFAGGFTQRKFWYNSATNNCEQLSYNGAGGNANNFDSIAQCESYCKTACPRGRPAYGAPDLNNALLIAPITTCSATSATTVCGTNYYCNTATTSSGAYCCPTATYVCSTAGGQIGTTLTVQVPEAGLTAPNLPTRIRWYYNAATSTCLSFTYNGQGGNYNNFASAAECNTFCSRSLCTAGDVLRDSNQAPIRCGSSGTGTCPVRYSCSTTGYCCPTRDFVCNQPVAAGSCMNYAPKWYYNSVSRTCTQFTYNGCQGNFNNFNTYTDCITFCTDVSTGPTCPQGIADRDTSSGSFVVCAGSGSTTIQSCNSGYYCYYDGSVYGCCPTQSQTCSTESSEPGTACITPVTRWYFNSQTNRCTTFTYNGCDGNSNNFATQIDCQDYCNVGGCPEGGEPYRETANNQYRACTNNGQECPVGYNCARVNLGTSTAASYCCPSRETICRLSQDPGISCGTNTLTRYSFNTQTRTCESFTYRGCGGNRNNFNSALQCSNFCNSAGCASGQIAFQDPTTRTVTSCTVGGTGCPSSYACVQSTLLNQGVCCGNNAPAGTCPTGQSAYMDSFTNGALQCQQAVDGQCQTGFSCTYSPTLTNSFCCGTSVVTCPSGGSVNLNSAGQPTQCTPGVTGNCASGYVCQPTTVLVGTVQSSTGYCCGTPNPCGQGFTTQFQNNLPQTCIVSSPTTCTTPYVCQQTTSGQAYCCVQATVTVPVCATGKSPLMILNAPTICNSGIAATACPNGYTCDFYAAANSNYCCTGSTTTNQRCPPNYTPLVPEQTCGTSPDTCPTAQGALCSFDRTTSRFICCSGGTVIQPTASVCPGGQPLAGTTCSRGSQCPAGYVCKPSTASGVCCPAPSSVCSLAVAAGTTCTTASSQRYAYSTATRSCTAFTYQGCNGNDNNFVTLQSCEDFCMMGLCSRGKAQVISGQPVQTCATAANCQTGYECVAPLFSGGSSICCPSRTTNCNLAQDPGRICASQSTVPLSLWYYNSASRTCQALSFSGCGGNGNNFDTSADCQTYCAAAPVGNPCPTPATAQLDASNQPILCTRTACGANFQCRYSTTASNYYCCSRVGGNNGCSTGSPYLYPGTRSPLACTVNGARCPTGYNCLQSTTFTGFQCCSTTLQAPSGIVGAAGSTTTISCTANDYCQTRLTNAYCDMAQGSTTRFKCICNANRSFVGGLCQ